MAGFKGPEVQEEVPCNLIPMIDIMFLLLLFFMLGADMAQRDLEDVVLPEASEVKEDENVRGDEGTTTINVHHSFPACAVHGRKDAAGKDTVCREMDHWRVAIRSKDYTADTMRQKLQDEADVQLEDQVDEAAGKRLSKRRAMVRADRLAPFGLVQKIIETCGSVGLYKVEVGAAQPPKP